MIPEDKYFTGSDRIFYSDGHRLAHSAVEGGFTTDTLFAAIKSLYEAIDGLNDSILALAKRQDVAIACCKGCHWCCHQAVFANSYELDYLAEYIKKNTTSKEFSAIVKRGQDKHLATSQMNEKEILRYKSPCPLLKDGACMVYDGRPMACRIYLSTRLETCLEFYRNPEHETNYPALIDFPLRAGRMMNEGFMDALKEFGVETTEFRLEAGLGIVLNDNMP